MVAHDIPTSDRDAFLEHAIGFDDDNNNYLKKTELTNAAVAWNEASPWMPLLPWNLKHHPMKRRNPPKRSQRMCHVPCAAQGSALGP